MALAMSQAPLVTQSALPLHGLSCPNAQISCRNTSAVTDLCCFNAPGGQLLQTQFWDTHPATGPSDAWTIHGLWPDHCDGTFDQYCDDGRSYRNITDILRSFDADDLLDTMNLYWKDYQGHDSSLWWHEWSKHGTCVSTLEPSCYANYQPQAEVVDYFRSAVTVYQYLPSYRWLSEANIVPSAKTRYDREHIEEALESKHGRPVTLRCRNGELNEIWYHFDVRGSVQSGQFIATNPDGTKGNCPAKGIKYLPKTQHRPSHTHTNGPVPTSTEAPFSGRGFLKVHVDGQEKGCLISDGTWYRSGTCATFHAKPTDDGFVLASRKGNCAFQARKSDTLLCAAQVKAGSVFDSVGGSLNFAGNATFFAEDEPRKFHRTKISSEPVDGGVELSITWEAV